MQRRAVRHVMIVPALALAACAKSETPSAEPKQALPDSGPKVIACTTEARAGLTIEVLDSATGAPAGKGTRIVARGTTASDSTPGPVPADGLVGLAYERAGTYTVTVTKPGYRPWSRAGIVVGADQCHVHPVRVTARLQR